MIVFKKNNKVPDEAMCYIDGTDSLKLQTTSPMFGFITLNNITKDEMEAFEGVLEIGYVVIEHIPFMILNFGNGFCFDSAIFNLEAKECTENAFNLVLIENITQMVINSRIVGLDTKIIERLIEDTFKIPYTNEEFIAKGKEIQENYEIMDIFNMCILKQTFLGN